MTSPSASSAKKPATDRPFWWFQGASVRTIADHLQQADPDTARIEIRIDENDAMTVTVVAAGVTESAVKFQPTNDSFRCPPICP